ncbi:hypothetical protein Bca4012_012192 [Brassica carinata]
MVMVNMGPVATYAYERQALVVSLLCHEWPKAKTSSSVKRGCKREIFTVELDKLTCEIITQKMFPLFV